MAHSVYSGSFVSVLLCHENHITPAGCVIHLVAVNVMVYDNIIGIITIIKENKVGGPRLRGTGPFDTKIVDFL